MSPSRSASSFREAFSAFSWFLPDNVIDDETLSYLFDALESGLGEDDREEFKDFVAPLLLELFDDDEAAARTACENVHDAIFAREKDDDDHDDDAEEEEKEKRKEIRVKLGGEWEDEKSEFEKEIERRLSEKKRDQLPDFSNNDAKNAAANNDGKAHEKEKRKMKKKLEENEEEVRKLFRELDHARETAAKRRIEGNASASSAIGTIEVGPFNVPNPGGGQDLINDCSVTFVPGRRYALIGRNGTGKSTLLKYLASRRVNDKVGFSEDVFVHYVNQEVTLNEEQEEWLPVDVVLHADVQRRLLLEELKELESNESGDVQRISIVHEHLDSIDSSSAHARASQLLRNLGFTEELANRKMKQLSGGWRVRTSLAAALFATPDVLLLDEPTNHLSIQAVMFLAK